MLSRDSSSKPTSFNLPREEHMKRRMSKALTVAFLIFPITVPAAWPQASAEKNKVQASAPDKAASETREVETHFSSAYTAPTFKAVELQPVSTPITLAREDDSKKIYEDIANAGGVSILFDPDKHTIQTEVAVTRLPENP